MIINQETLDWSAKQKPSLHKQQLKAIKQIDLGVFACLSDEQKDMVRSIMEYDPGSAVRYVQYASNPKNAKRSTKAFFKKKQ